MVVKWKMHIFTWGWIGNQVLLFQEIKYFIEKKTGSDRAEQGEQ